MEVASHWVSRVDATGRLYCFTMLPKEQTPQDQEWFVITLLCFDVLVTTYYKIGNRGKGTPKKTFLQTVHDVSQLLLFDFIQSVKEFHIKLIYQLCTFS